MTSCPECENDLDIEVEEVEEGDVVACDECGTEYEIVGVEPLELSQSGRGHRRGRRRLHWKRKRRKSEREPRKSGGMGGFCRPYIGDRSSGTTCRCWLMRQNLGQRNVAGLVVDDNSAPVQGATVFLKNQKTKSIRSYTSASNGSFRFAQVNMTDDYDLWAEKDGKKSATKDRQFLGCPQGF